MKKTTKQLFLVGLVAIIALIGNSCKIGIDCEWVEGIDYEALTVADSAQGENLLFLPDLVLGDSIEYGTEYIIQDSSVYAQWKADAGNCTGCFFPDIDFNERTLVGKYYQLECNEYPFLMVTKSGNVYTHYTKATDDTKCVTAACLNYTFAWVTIPKLQPDESIEFIFRKAYYDCDC